MAIKSSSQTEKKLFFWVFLGPLSMLLSLSMLILKTPHDFPLAPVVALIGIALTWMYRLQGLFGALAILFSTALYQILYYDAGDSLWFIGSIFTVAFSYLITFLTLEDAGEVIANWRESALTGFQEKEAITQKLVNLENEIAVEKEGYALRIKALEEKLTTAVNEQASLEKVNELSRIELLSTITKHDQLNEELFALRHEKSKLEEHLEDVEAKSSAFQDSFEKWQREKTKGEEMGHLIERLTREKDLFESTVSRIQEELELKQEQLQCKQEELTQNESALKLSKEAVQNLTKALEEEKQKAPPPVVIEPLPELAPATESEYRRLYGMHKQLRDQFQQKSDDLDEARKALFHAQEEASTLALQLQELESSPPPELKVLSEELEATHAKYEEALREVSSLEAFISNLMQNNPSV